MKEFFATCPKGLESLLFEELKNLKLQDIRETVSGVHFKGEMADAQRACLWSRFASRILLNITEFYCDLDTELYLAANGIAWEKYFTVDKSIAVSFSGTNKNIRNTQYGALKVKDAICDRFTKVCGRRPDVDKHNADVQIFVNLSHETKGVISLDLSGTALYKREIHRGTGIAPLKENLASAMVVRSGFNNESNFLDPMCGSGTLLLEAASILTNRAPGLSRSSFGFKNLEIFDKDSFDKEFLNAKILHAKSLKEAVDNGLEIVGFDADANIVDIAKSNIYKAGFESLVKIYHSDIASLYNPFTNQKKVFIVTNPPYGERMGNFNELISLYQLLGQKVKENFVGSRLAVISSSEDLLSCLKLRYDKSYKLYNGALLCQLRLFDINNEEDASQENKSHDAIVDFENRLAKNLKQIQKWAQQENINAYRVYDADLPDYKAAIDCYGDYYIIQEYVAPSTVNQVVAKRRLLDMISATIKVTGAKGSHVILKSREKQKGKDQYEKSEEQKQNFFEVYENGARFKVNLEDYLDTGLFLDARPIRKMIKDLCKDKEFLNLFSYTASASVMAALGGATKTVSVDMSKTYLNWGMDNFRLNDLDLTNHEFIQADCLSYLSADHDKQYDVVYIDPPTFSNSKRMDRTFEVQRDHVALLSNLTRHVKDGGTIIFCTNKRGFKIDAEALAQYGLDVEDISVKSIPRDFKRNTKIHSCFILTFTKENRVLEIKPMVDPKLTPKWSKSLNKREDTYSFKGEREFRKTHEYYGESSFTRKENKYKDRDNKFTKDSRFNDKKVNRFKKGSLVKEEKKVARVWGPEGVKDL